MPFTDMPAAAVPASILGGRDAVDEATSKDNANTPEPGIVSKLASKVGSKVTDSLPSAPDISNPKKAAETAGRVGSSQLPDQAKRTAANILGDTVSLADDAKVLGGNDVQPDVKGAQNLPKPGAVSQQISKLGNAVGKKLPNPPDLSNPKGSAESNFPTIPKVLSGNPNPKS
ncbi:hypothetical protein WJX72_000907 [[Myrmecia] bisecta]|uniref:Uncharacterized protein n=1 Tax=[Myrmecia] bisecta TaxID=41462 RepID=A0AAW1R4H6_9CHLO